MRILLIEDDDALRSEISEFLMRRHHVVVACASLAEGRAASREPDNVSTVGAIVCDVNLPDGNGVEFCAETISLLPNRRWILMSGGHDPEKVARLDGTAEASIEIVDKPVRIKQLESLLTAGPG